MTVQQIYSGVPDFTVGLPNKNSALVQQASTFGNINSTQSDVAQFSNSHAKEPEEKGSFLGKAIKWISLGLLASAAIKTGRNFKSITKAAKSVKNWDKAVALGKNFTRNVMDPARSFSHSSYLTSEMKYADKAITKAAKNGGEEAVKLATKGYETAARKLIKNDYKKVKVELKTAQEALAKATKDKVKGEELTKLQQNVDKLTNRYHVAKNNLHNSIVTKSIKPETAEVSPVNVKNNLHNIIVKESSPKNVTPRKEVIQKGWNAITKGLSRDGVAKVKSNYKAFVKESADLYKNVKAGTYQAANGRKGVLNMRLHLDKMMQSGNMAEVKKATDFLMDYKPGQDLTTQFKKIVGDDTLNKLLHG